MNALTRGLLVAGLQCAIVLTLTGRYAYDRATLPRVWARTAPRDPRLPLRGRYVELRVEVITPDETNVRSQGNAVDFRFNQHYALSIEDGKLVARRSPKGKTQIFFPSGAQTWTAWDPVDFFIPDNAPDPTVLHVGEELWVELSLAPSDTLRPVRLAVKKDGVLRPLALN